MKVLDIISDSPKPFIFHKSSNKTKFGGILTLIYFIVLAFFTFAYIYDFYVYEKYEFTSFYKDIKESERENIKKEEVINNIETSFTFEIIDKDGKNMTDKFLIIDRNDYEIEGIYKKKINELELNYIGIFYRCANKNCSLITKNETLMEYRLRMIYNSKIMEHENDDSPISDEKFNISFRFKIEDCYILDSYWQFYNYKNQKGAISRMIDTIFKIPNNFTFAKISKAYYYYYELNEFHSQDPYKPVVGLFFFNQMEGIYLYTRKRRSELDYLADLIALGSALLNVICKVFGFVYSRSFDTYKIVEKILFKENKRLKSIELINNNDKPLENLTEKYFENKFNNKNRLNNRLYSDDSINLNNTNLIDNDFNQDIIDDNEDRYDSLTKLPKFRFFDYLFNNIYNKKCCNKMKSQILISNCEDILYKYFSIDNIVYNQIRFENLMRDYKWNNIKLKSIYNNELIKDLINNLENDIFDY